MQQLHCKCMHTWYYDVPTLPHCNNCTVTIVPQQLHYNNCTTTNAQHVTMQNALGANIFKYIPQHMSKRTVLSPLDVPTPFFRHYLKLLCLKKVKYIKSSFGQVTTWGQSEKKTFQSKGSKILRTN